MHLPKACQLLPPCLSCSIQFVTWPLRFIIGLKKEMLRRFGFPLTWIGLASPIFGGLLSRQWRLPHNKVTSSCRLLNSSHDVTVCPAKWKYSPSRHILLRENIWRIKRGGRLSVIWYGNVVEYIPHICHFFYTVNFFGEWNLHRKTPIFCVKSVKKTPIFRVKSVKKRQFFTLNL